MNKNVTLNTGMFQKNPLVLRLPRLHPVNIFPTNTCNGSACHSPPTQRHGSGCHVRLLLSARTLPAPQTPQPPPRATETLLPGSHLPVSAPRACWRPRTWLGLMDPPPHNPYVSLGVGVVEGGGWRVEGGGTTLPDPNAFH